LVAALPRWEIFGLRDRAGLRGRLWRLALLVAAVGPLNLGLALGPGAEEIHQAHRWSGEHFKPGSPGLPFSFVFGGRPSSELPGGWTCASEHRRLNGQLIEHQLTFADPRTGLQVECVAVEYTDYPVVEWTVWFRNRGTRPLPILEDLNALDLRIPVQAPGEIVLRSWRGDSNSPESYEPAEQTLSPGAKQRFAPTGGRPTNGAFPYYNLQIPGGGLVLAVGWPGQWAATFTRADTGELRIAAGQELTHFSLKPGEQARTPLIACLFWRGTDAVRAQNLWRRWMLAHNLPHPGGKPLGPLLAFCSGGFFEGLKVSETSEKRFIDVLGEQGIKLDYWWMDAGWYPCGAWPQVGTWEPDPQRFPKGLRAVSDYVHARDMKLIVWFEPERVEAGSWLSTRHPEWLLGGKLLNLGNPEAKQWLTEHVDGLIREQGIDLYRQDFNMDPLEFWRRNDAPDRQGITENLHVQGYLAFWDELRRRHPGLLIDSCASGGRRNDLETLRRAVPLLRSDYQSFQGDPAFALGNQCHTYGLSSWIPYYGQGVYYNADHYVYSVRSHFCPAFGMAVDVRKSGLDWPLYRRLAGEWRQVADLMLGDYYPLTPYSLAETNWMAWQFHAPDRRAGFVQAFRRSQNEQATTVLRLHGLVPKAQYIITDFDLGMPGKMSGKALMQSGLPVEIKARPGAAVIAYKEGRER
jgi:alpha-galactosidase